jgi:hypothetical protein
MAELNPNSTTVPTKSSDLGIEVVSTNTNSYWTDRLNLERTVTVVTALILLASGAVFADLRPSGASSTVPHGVVPIGQTNEGGSGTGTGSATGVLDITAAPCVGIALKKTYESLPTRITLLRGSKAVASWEIYGEQRIAWVEPVGTYRIHSNQYPAKRDVSVVVSTVRPAKADLIPHCK